jgi:hypothetical protein
MAWAKLGLLLRGRFHRGGSDRGLCPTPRTLLPCQVLAAIRAGNTHLTQAQWDRLVLRGDRLNDLVNTMQMKDTFLTVHGAT